MLYPLSYEGRGRGMVKLGTNLRRVNSRATGDSLNVAKGLPRSGQGTTNEAPHKAFT
jgi:hypothetical protein